MSVNKVILLGNLGKDPELRQTSGNNSVCTFSLATNEKKKDASGNYIDHTEWHNIVVWGNIGENCHKYLRKGKQAFIEGKIVSRKWQDKEGKDRYTTEILASSVQFIGLKNDSNQTESYPSKATNNNANNQSAEFQSVYDSLKTGDSIGQESGLSDDDIPF